MNINTKTYELVIPEQLGISIESLKKFFVLNGYQVEEDQGNCIIKYRSLGFAQKAEQDLKQRFDCRLYSEDGLIIKCDTFKEHGKWNSEENIIIPKNTPNWDIRAEVEKRRSSPDLTYHGTYPNNVPFLLFPRAKIKNSEDHTIQLEINGIRNNLNTLHHNAQIDHRDIKSLDERIKLLEQYVRNLQMKD